MNRPQIHITPLSRPPIWCENISSELPIIFYESNNIRCYMEFTEDYLDGDPNRRFIDFRNYCISLRSINDKLALIHIVSVSALSLDELDNVIDTMNDTNNDLVEVYKKINIEHPIPTTPRTDIGIQDILDEVEIPISEYSLSNIYL